MKVPFSRPTINPADISRVSGQLASGRLDTGPQVQLFEEALARFLSVSAALGRSQLSRVPARRQRLKELAKRYLQSDVIRRAAYRPFRDSGEIWHLFPLMIPNRDTFRRKLARAGVETSIHYQALTSMPAYAHLVRCPEAERLGESLVSLPLYPTLTDEEQDHVICATEAAL